MIGEMQHKTSKSEEMKQESYQPSELPVSAKSLTETYAEKLAEETELAQRVSQGDPIALTQLYENYVGRVYGYFFRRARDKSEAESLTSETFTRAIQALAQDRYMWQGKPFGAWLFGIANKVMMEQRRELQKEATTESINVLPEREELESEAESPLDSIIQAEENNALWQLVATLPPVEQELLTMRYVYGLPYAEIAERLGRTENAVKQLHYRAIRDLRDIVSNEAGVNELLLRQVP